MGGYCTPLSTAISYHPPARRITPKSRQGTPTSISDKDARPVVNQLIFFPAMIMYAKDYFT